MAIAKALVMKSLFNKIACSAFLVLPVAIFMNASAGCTMGGCPWTELTSPVVSSQSSCLHIGTENVDGATGGCVNPTLVGVNQCDAPLTFPGSFHGKLGATGEDVVIAPGAAFYFEVNGEVATTREEDDIMFFLVPAKVGTEDISIEFEGYFP